MRLVALGQALIEHDPRPLDSASLAEVATRTRGADAVFTNLEAAVDGAFGPHTPVETGNPHHGTPPETLDFLKELGVGLLAMSNNHTYDLGASGVRSAMHEAQRRGFAYAGIGATAREAPGPAYLDTPGGRIALVSMTSTNARPEAAATDTRPGVNFLRPDDPEDEARNLGAIQEAAAHADEVLVYQHYHGEPGGVWQRRWVRACLAAGATLYVAHGQPRLGPIEIHRGHALFYNLGNFIFHTHTPIGHYGPEAWQGALADVTLHRGRCTRLGLTPLLLDEGTPGERFLQQRGFPRLAGAAAAQRILTSLSDLSAPFGTRLDIAGAVAEVRIDHEGQQDAPAEQQESKNQ